MAATDAAACINRFIAFSLIRRNIERVPRHDCNRWLFHPAGLSCPRGLPEARIPGGDVVALVLQGEFRVNCGQARHMALMTDFRGLRGRVPCRRNQCEEKQTMSNSMKFYIDGAWVDPVTPKSLDVINPATEEAFAQISIGSAADVDLAVAAAKRAFTGWSQTTKQERLELFDAIMAAYKNHYAAMADAISKEMGAPATFAQKVQAATGLGHFKTMSKLLANFEFDEDRGTTRISKEPIGVCGMITPWNWPVNQIAAKVAPALAAGCTMVLKPSEIAPMSGIVFAEIMHEAGVPKGVFNLVNGDGPGVGSAISAHPDVDMVSFTGSTRAGIAVAQNAAPTVKRVSQELGGKSANIILDDADFQKAVFGGTMQCFGNTGQSCNAPTRMLVPMERMEEAGEIAKAAAAKVRVGDPNDESTTMGPLVSQAHGQGPGLRGEGQGGRGNPADRRGTPDRGPVRPGGLHAPDDLCRCSR